MYCGDYVLTKKALHTSHNFIYFKDVVTLSIPPFLVLAILINFRPSAQYGTTNFHKILYTELNILIGYKFGNLYLQIKMIAEITAINYLHGIRVLF